MVAEPVGVVPPRAHRALRVVAPAVLVVLGTLVRAANLGGPAFGFDELYHVLAARGLLEGHGFEIADDRPYTRARLVTLLTAGAFALFGEGEATARLPALAFGVATLPLVYASGRLLFGRVAGLVALGLAALSPDLIDVSRFARLYSALAFTTLLAAVAGFRTLGTARAPGSGAALGWASLAAGAFLVAAHLHPAALGLILVVQVYALLIGAGLALTGRPREAITPVAVALALLAVEGAFAAVPGVRGSVIAALEPLPWQDADAGPMLYHYDLATRYGWLWYLVWPATVAAVLAAPRPGLFLAVAFWVPFVAISAAVATRTPRYVVHLLPFAWLLVGAAAHAAWPAAWSGLLRAAGRLAPGAGAGVGRTLIAAALAAAVLVPLLSASPSVLAAARRPTRTAGSFVTGHFADWRAAARRLEGEIGPPVAVVTSVPLASRYYLGRPAVRLLAPGRSAAGWEAEGRAVVQDAEDLVDLRAAHEAVVVLVEAWRWESPGKLEDGLRRALETSCVSLGLPSESALVGFRCEDGAALRSPPPPGRGPSAPGPRRSGEPPRAGSPR